MKYDDYLESQFSVKVVSKGKYKGRVCFHTPLADYTLTKTDFKKVLEKLNGVELK